MKTLRTVRRAVASAAFATFFIAIPGPACYQAAAQTVSPSALSAAGAGAAGAATAGGAAAIRAVPGMSFGLGTTVAPLTASGPALFLPAAAAQTAVSASATPAASLSRATVSPASAAAPSLAAPSRTAEAMIHGPTFSEKVAAPMSGLEAERAAPDKTPAAVGWNSPDSESRAAAAKFFDGQALSPTVVEIAKTVFIAIPSAIIPQASAPQDHAARSFDLKLGAQSFAPKVLAEAPAPTAPMAPVSIRAAVAEFRVPTGKKDPVPLFASLRQAADLIRSRPASDPGWLGVTLAMVALLLVPLRGETAFHEFGHYVAARMVGIRPSEVRLHVPLSEGSDTAGYVSHATTTPRKQIAVSLAGPLFSWLYFGGVLAAFVPIVAGALSAHFLLGYTAFGVLIVDGIFGLLGALGGGTSDLKTAFDAWRERPNSRTRRVRLTQANLDLINKLMSRHDSSRQEILRKALSLLHIMSGLAQDGAIELHAKDRSVKVIFKGSSSSKQKQNPYRPDDSPAQTVETAENAVLTFEEPALRAIDAAKSWLGVGWTEQVLRRALILLDIADQYTDETGTVSVVAGSKQTDIQVR